MTLLSAPAASRSHRDVSSMQLASHGCSVDAVGGGDGGKGIACFVACACVDDVVRVHLSAVHSTRHSKLFQVHGDGPVMYAEDLRDGAQRSSRLVLNPDRVDF